MRLIAEILAIGSELLLGQVLDTNSHWLCGRLTLRGAQVCRVTHLPDHTETISDAIRSALDRRVQLLITSGGLGPTEDDLTLQAVSKALGQPLRCHTEALAWVTQRFAEFARAGYVDSADITPDREKMALLPEGSTPLYNGVGVAPGVLISRSSTTIVCLPGVPDELRAIFVGPLRTTLDDLLGAGVACEWQAHVGTGDESVLVPILRQVAAQHPRVYLKSRARAFGDERRFLVTLTACGETQRQATQFLERAWAAFEAALGERSIAVLDLTRGAAPVVEA